MLPKIWKKVLLAICIIACLFNITSKLVNRTSLELNLKSVQGGESILSIFEDETDKQESDTIEGVINQNPIDNETSNTENVINSTNTQTVTSPEENKTTDFIVIY